MSSVQKILSNMNQKTKYCVYGWIRKAEEELQLGYFPIVLSKLCVLYYKEEMFSIIGSDIQRSDDLRRITKKCIHGFLNNSYGSVVIDSNSNHTYQWDIKIHRDSEIHGPPIRRGGVMIGISTSLVPNKYIHWYENEPNVSNAFSYILRSTMKYRDKQYTWWKEQGITYKTGDVISFILNLSEREISVKLNHEDHGIMFKDIARSADIKYRLIVSLSDPNNSVELINFKVLS